jgi:hypothetical protein
MESCLRFLRVEEEGSMAGSRRGTGRLIRDARQRAGERKPVVTWPVRVPTDPNHGHPRQWRFLARGRARCSQRSPHLRQIRFQSLDHRRTARPEARSRPPCLETVPSRAENRRLTQHCNVRPLNLSQQHTHPISSAATAFRSPGPTTSWACPLVSTYLLLPK